MTPERQIKLGQDFLHLVRFRLQDLEAKKLKYQIKMDMCEDRYKLKLYREQLYTINESIETSKKILERWA